MFKNIDEEIARLEALQSIGLHRGSGAGRDEEKLRINSRLWSLRKRKLRGPVPRKPYTYALTPARQEFFARRRDEWAKQRADKEAARQERTRQIAERVAQNKAAFPQKNRERALEAWNKVGVFKHRKRVIHDAFIRAIRRHAKQQKDDQRSLVSAMRRVEARQNALLRKHLRRRFDKAIRRLAIPGSRSAVAQKLLGCSLSELRHYLEKQFQPGMAWSNHGFRGWHIDHIRPLAKFDLRDPAQQHAAFHFTNLQPLWWKENLEKSDS